MHWLMIAGSMILTACGSWMMRITWLLRMPIGVRGLGLSLGHGVDAGAEHLGEDRPVVEDQAR